MTTLAASWWSSPARADKEKKVSADPIQFDLAALQDGDPQETERVLRQLLPHCRRWLGRLLGPRTDLDDATQDSLIAIADALRRFEGRSKLTTFAHRITVRTAYKYFRKRSREEALTLVPPPPDEIDPESKAMQREALRRLYRTLERIPKKRRVAFVLCCIEGMSPMDAAEIEGISSGAMRTRLSHARAEVARRLDADPYISQLLGSRRSR